MTKPSPSDHDAESEASRSDDGGGASDLAPRAANDVLIDVTGGDHSAPPERDDPVDPPLTGHDATSVDGANEL